MVISLLFGQGESDKWLTLLMTAQTPLRILELSRNRKEVKVMSDGLKVLVGAVVVLLLVGGFSGWGMGYGMTGGMGSMMSGGMMSGGLFGMLFALLFWVLVIALIVALVVWIVNETQRR